LHRQIEVRLVASLVSFAEAGALSFEFEFGEDDDGGGGELVRGGSSSLAFNTEMPPQYNSLPCAS